MTCLNALLIVRIDGTDDFDPHVLTLEESSFVHIGVLGAHRMYLSRPFNLPRV